MRLLTSFKSWKRYILFLFTISILSFYSIAQDLTVYIDPADSHQEVIFGGDGKLTIAKWADGELETTCDYLYNKMNLKTLRIPIFALLPIDDPIYDKVIDVCKEVQSINPNVKIFASIANGDGAGNNYHQHEKFPENWRGCCSYNIYSLNLTRYAEYLDDFMDRMSDGGVTVDYLGPYNEDNADNADYRKTFDQMDKLGNTKKVGLETWSLQTGINNVDDVEDRLDIVGSHIYDDENISDPEYKWGQLISKSSKPVWFTESTRYKTFDNIENLVAGMENIIDPINAGVKQVIFYQVVKRFVEPDGTTQAKKYTGFKNLVNKSNNKRVLESRSTDNNIDVVAFGNYKNLTIHMINKTSSNKKAKIKLQSGYKADGTTSRIRWTDSATGVKNSYVLENKDSWVVTLPANSYVNVITRLDTQVKSVMLDDSVLDYDLALYPNPSSGLLNISTPAEVTGKSLDVSVYSLEGRLVLSQRFEAQRVNEINMNDLEKGVYLVNVRGDNVNLKEKIILTN